MREKTELGQHTLTRTGLGLDVYQSLPNEGRGVNIVVEFPDDTVVPAGDGDGGFVALDLTDTVKLRHSVPLLHVPEPQQTGL